MTNNEKFDFFKSLKLYDIINYTFDDSVSFLSSGVFIAVVINKSNEEIKVKEIYGNGNLVEYEINFELTSFNEYATLTYIGNIDSQDTEKIKSKFPEYFI